MDNALAVYVHWPFCGAICPYCDFNVRRAGAEDQARYRDALVAEARHFAKETNGRALGSLYFGGGTPSLLAPETVAHLIGAVRGLWPADADLEVSLEANPDDMDRFRGFADAGVTRLSLGVQALDDGALEFLGRSHSAAGARAAMERARGIFPQFSFDLIYGRPGQTAAAWRRELLGALDLAGGHASLYQLTIEPGTPFHQRGVRAADEDLAADLYLTAQEVMAAAGMSAYEVSNHARAGSRCRHNLAYWTGGDYVGLGPGAHGRLSQGGAAAVTDALYQIHTPGRWLSAVEGKGHGTARRTALDPHERLEEIVLLGLRLDCGLERARFFGLTGTGLEAAIGAARLEPLVAGGFLVLDAQGLRATPAGRVRLNAVTAALLA